MRRCDPPFIRRPVVLHFDPETDRTLQSFRDSCDVNQIVDRYKTTGVIDHVVIRPAQYGDAPETSFFDAAVSLAEIQSLYAEGYEPPSEAGGSTIPETEGLPIGEPEKGSESLSEPPTASDDES